MSLGFIHWELRTTDVKPASSFYNQLLEEAVLDITALPDSALARGARPHWLGHLATADKAAAERSFVARGATLLGDGRAMRDPFGAMFALKPRAEPQRSDVVWQLHMSASPERARSDYAEVCGMRAGQRLDVPGMGVFEQFSWGDGGVAGCLGDITDKPHIHPQWLFYFRVADLGVAIEHVRARGGLVVGPMALPNGCLAAACDDPQGAAFGLMQAAPAQ